MSPLFRVLIVLLSILLLVRFAISRLMSGSRSDQSSRRRSSPVQGRMVRDPYCGTYVATSLAVIDRIGGLEHHFCSTKCRDRYLLREQLKS